MSIENVEGDLIRLVSPKKTFPRCHKHDEKMKLFCEPCGELICRDCTVHVHKGHEFCVIADTFESHKKEILDSLGPVEKQLEATKTALVNLDSRCGEIAQRKTNIDAEIHTNFQEIYRALDARKADVKAKLKDHTQKQLKTLSAQQKKVKILQTQRSSCLHFVRESIRTGSPGDVLKMKQGVMKQVRELVDTFDPKTLEPRETSNTCFVPSIEMAKSCKEFGDICHASIPSACTKAEKSTARFRFLSPISPIPPNAELISRITRHTTKCVVKERGKGEYKISYQPTVGGAHQLHVRVGKEVAGSFFPVAVKTPIDKLGTDVRTIAVKNPFGVAVNKSGEVIVTDEVAGVVSIFSPTGNKLRTLDTQGTAVGRMSQPRSVAVDGDDNILVMNFDNCQLLKFSRGGDLIAAVGSRGDGPGQLKHPLGVCVNSVNGKVFIINSGAHCVHILNSDLTFSSDFGSRGSGNGQFISPWDVASDRCGCVYVADAGNHRVQVFTPNGGYLRQFGKEGSGNGELCGPVGICVDSDDRVYVGEDGNGRVSVFTCDGVFLKSFGSEGSRPGQFDTLFGIAVDQYGVVYVSGYNKLQQFY